MKKTFLIILITTIYISKTHAQETNGIGDTLELTLPEVWLKAEEFSRAIEIKKTEINISNEKIKDAMMERLPEIGIKGSAEKATNIPIYEHGLLYAPTQHEVIHTLYRLGTDFYLNIYDGNKLNLKIREEKTLHQISIIQKEQTVSEIRYNAASLYLELQKSYVFLELIKQDIADQEKQLTEIKSFHKNGIILKSDVLRVELDLSKRKMLLVQIQNDILIANQKLNIIIGEPDERIIRPAAGLFPRENEMGSYEDCMKQALLYSYPYHISEQFTEVSKLRLKEVKANVRPKIGLYGDFYYANPQIFLFPYNPYWYSLGVAGVRASFPISSIYHNIHKKREATLELEKEEEVHKQTEDNLRQQVNEAHLRYKEAIIQIEVSKVSVDQAEENARIIKEAYFNQTALITDLLDADIQLLQTRFELESAKIMAQNKYYLLQNIIGTL